jgi:hypothetical protein
VIIIFFTHSLPSPIADELQRQGHQLFECLAISEVLALQEQHPGAQIVIDHSVPAEEAKVIQQHYPTITLNETATATDFLWE